MSTATVVYQGGLHCELRHQASGDCIATDAPLDNHGRGEAFSPTDLLSASLAACAMTIMGIKADALGISLEGARAEVHKEMAANPRRVAKIRVEIYLPVCDPHHRSVLQAAARSCPVAHSLSADLQQEWVFHD